MTDRCPKPSKYGTFLCCARILPKYCCEPEVSPSRPRSAQRVRVGFRGRSAHGCAVLRRPGRLGLRSLASALSRLAEVVYPPDIRRTRLTSFGHGLGAGMLVRLPGLVFARRCTRR